MKKDTLYIDVEDDITAIIGKVKASPEKIVALVPPKRAGVLQSAVNLKLIQRAASAKGKHLVLITHDRSLASLAAGAAIPVAKTLSSRPELAKIKAPDMTEEEVINGDELPVGDHAKTAPISTKQSDEDIISSSINDELSSNDKPKAGASRSFKNAKSKIPNFDSFRKRLFIGIGAGILLIVFLVWAIVFAPHATVNIKAKTTSIDLRVPITIKNDTPTAPAQAQIRPIVEQIKKTNSTSFQATGKKQVGEKATGTMRLDRTSISSNPITIPAGTGFSSGNFTFVTVESVQLGGTSIGPGGIVQDSATVRVQAANIGEDYNLSARDYTPTVSGIDASGSQMSGGSKKDVTVVSANDVQNAQKQLAGQDQNSIKRDLNKKFDKNRVIIISESFNTTQSEPSVSPAVDNEATTAQLTVETTYTLLALKKSDINSMLDHVMADELKQVKEKNQQVYDNGKDDIKLTRFDPAGSLVLQGTGYIGPKINKEALKKKVAGKNYEEIRQLVMQTDGVQDVSTDFSPFWVSRAPDEKKIDIVFKISK
jgi:hypothetical protein